MPLPLGVQAVEDFEAAHFATLEVGRELADQGLLDYVPERSSRLSERWSFWRDHTQELRTLLGPCLIDALRTEDWPLARRIGAEYWFKLGDAPNADHTLGASDCEMEAARRLLEMIPWSAHAPRGERGFINPIGLIDGKSVEGNPATPLIDNLDQATKLLSDARYEWARAESGDEHLRAIAVTESPDLRRLLFAIRHHLSTSRPGRGASYLVLDASPKALRDFCERFSDHQGFLGLRGQVTSRAGGYALRASVGLEAVIDDVPTRIEVSCGLADDLGTKDEAYTSHELLDAEVQRIGCARFLAPQPIRLEEAPPRGFRYVSPQSIEPDGEPLGVDDLVGSRGCSHQGHRWDAARYQLHLVCADCVRVVTSVPFHRLPEDHHLLDDLIPRDYVYRERARAAAFGEDLLPEGIIFEDLRLRDGVASIDVRDYSGLAPRAASAGRVSTVAEAMRRR